MKKFLALFLCLVLAASVCAAKKRPSGNNPADYRLRSEVAESYVSDNRIYPVEKIAAFDTTWLAYYNFDDFPVCDTQGWTSVDITAQPGEFFHVDDFAACGPGMFGGLYAIEGAKSLWCGACPTADHPLCTYATLPGYGNDWDQAFCTRSCVFVDSFATIDYLVMWDSEPGYDYTSVEYAFCSDPWTRWDHWISDYDGTGGPVFVSDAIPVTMDSVRIRFHFESDNAWSDEDGLWDTDGAIIIDSLTVRCAGAGVLVPTELFEDESVGANGATDWESCTPPGYGDLAELRRAIPTTYQNDPVEEDPCTSNFSCLWTFYKGSTANYSCNTPNPSAQQLVVPYLNSRNQYVNNEIWSPWIPLTGSGSVINLEFDVYRDLKLDALIFYVWHVRTKIGDNCPSGWVDRNFLGYYGGGKDWFRAVQPFGDLIPPGTTDIQVALGVKDICPYVPSWCGLAYYKCHSHAPLFDNVAVYRVLLNGPQFFVKDMDMFQDNFSADGTITGPARADMAQDVLPRTSPNILPGDSVCITVNDPEVGLANDSYTGCGPAVYCYISVDRSPGSITPAEIEAPETRAGCGTRFPYATTTSSAGRTWFCYRMDSCFTSNGSLAADRYCVDFNDNVFIPGDTCWFFFGAENASGKRTYYSLPYGQTTSIRLTAGEPDEFTILPAAGDEPRNDILYVDGMNFRGAQPFFDTTFSSFGMRGDVDRYDVRGPDSGVGNRPGSRVVNVTNQLINVYRTIIWNTGDMTLGCIGDGVGYEKSDDASMLFTFLDQHTTGYVCGVYFSGDDLADEWTTLTGPGAIALRAYMSYSLINRSHVAAGAGVNPYIVDAAGPVFLPSDQAIAYGGCPTVNDFDVITPLGAATAEMDYARDTGGGPGAHVPRAIVAQTTTNAVGNTARVVLSGFSFHYIRDDCACSEMDRFIHMRRILNYLGQYPDDVIAVHPDARVNSLSQNYPNPFNPVTTIKYTLKERAYVSLKVYNVAGQLVCTLVDEIQSPEAVKPVEWRGLNNRGQQVASGVYFYKLVTKGFTQTKKMVLLK